MLYLGGLHSVPEYIDLAQDKGLKPNCSIVLQRRVRHNPLDLCWSLSLLELVVAIELQESYSAHRVRTSFGE